MSARSLDARASAARPRSHWSARWPVAGWRLPVDVAPPCPRRTRLPLKLPPASAIWSARDPATWASSPCARGRSSKRPGSSSTITSATRKCSLGRRPGRRSSTRARKPGRTPCARRKSTRCSWRKPARASASCGSRAATPSSSGAGARRRSRWRGPAWRSRSCRESPSAIAGPAYAGIPVTQRGHVSQLTIFTGHEDPEKGGSSVDFAQIAKAPGTRVMLMGVERLESISRQLARRRGGPRAARGARALGHDPPPADAHRHAWRHRVEGRRRELRGSGGGRVRGSGQPARRTFLVREEAAVRPADRRHPHPQAGRRPEQPPARPGRGSARNPHHPH